MCCKVMSLVAIGVISRRHGQPLFMHSFVESSDLLFGQYGQNDTIGAEFFGDILVEESLNSKSEWSCEDKYQFMLHSASDRLDEILAEGKWKKPGNVGADACWVGLLCSMGSFNAFGYLLFSSYSLCNTLISCSYRLQAARLCVVLDRKF